MAKKLHWFYLASFALVLIWSVIKPRDWLTWALEASPILIIWGVAIWLYRRFRLTDLTYTWLWISSIIVIIGGHYSYEHMPLFSWLRDTFDLQRNHYDRFGHFIKGITAALLAREVILRKTPVDSRFWLNFFVLSFCLGLAALYEIVEFLSVMVLHGESTEFLGMQGDIWDAQWDMLMTFLGAILALPVFRKWQDRQMGTLPY
ncbi:hypothetical protein CBW65_03340 [Tumebacillus avium]|uniref:DUF2238 domain-containing protein n=1 Tax=Tumebacillus avium TaxID=1903704 RepID=A0A1Y0IIC1_9BACL|nr:DUF2238 domain-containing protein [Tumebacillus avium]ARU60197.1 hypothetical protein CBW65_03340 [Tumebacillus avium]